MFLFAYICSVTKNTVIFAALSSAVFALLMRVGVYGADCNLLVVGTTWAAGFVVVLALSKMIGWIVRRKN